MANKVDLTGKRFGRLVVLEQAEYHIDKKGRKIRMWKCKCDCGNETIVRHGGLQRGTTTSCGCFHKEIVGSLNRTHGLSANCGRLYPLWKSIKYRCYNKNSKSYSQYGGRGIAMCDEWKNDFLAFHDWAIANGYKEEKTDKGLNILTIDRIDVNGNYEPSNCRWATNSEQQLNKRNNHIVYYKGDYIPLAELSNITGINAGTLRSRLNKGMSVKDAVNYRRKLLLFSFNGETKTLKEWCEKIGINYSTAYRRYRKGLPIDEILRKV